MCIVGMAHAALLCCILIFGLSIKKLQTLLRLIKVAKIITNIQPLKKPTSTGLPYVAVWFFYNCCMCYISVNKNTDINFTFLFYWFIYTYSNTLSRLLTHFKISPAIANWAS
jgi:hypothetical protein